MPTWAATQLPLEPASGSVWHQTRPTRVAFLLTLIWVLSLADLGFTLWAHRWTPFVEGNPLAARLLAAGMTVSVVLLKLTTTLIATHLFWQVRRFHRAELALWLVIVGLTGLAMLWNQYTTAALTHAHWVEHALSKVE